MTLSPLKPQHNFIDTCINFRTQNNIYQSSSVKKYSKHLNNFNHCNDDLMVIQAFEKWPDKVTDIHEYLNQDQLAEAALDIYSPLPMIKIVHRGLDQ